MRYEWNDSGEINQLLAAETGTNYELSVRWRCARTVHSTTNREPWGKRGGGRKLRYVDGIDSKMRASTSLKSQCLPKSARIFVYK